MMVSPAAAIAIAWQGVVSERVGPTNQVVALAFTVKAVAARNAATYRSAPFPIFFIVILLSSEMCFRLSYSRLKV
ncbi:MAG: hypothetical protein DMG25_03825 [Acidobacteria bacterium]|nr:MAG: hypothetical protein DMG25_03825 [Acidobacteriota bacterium]